MDEELYDSLEDDIKSLSDISLKSIAQDDDDYLKNDLEKIPYKLSDIVPFYKEETLKQNVIVPKKKLNLRCVSKIPVLASSYLKCKKTSSKSSNSNSNENSISNNKKGSRKKKDLVKEKEPKSYLKIFYTKIGYPDKRQIQEPRDSTRANDGDLTYRTAVSGSSHLFDDGKTSNSVTESEVNFYLNHIKNDTFVPPLNLSETKTAINLRKTESRSRFSNSLKSRTCQNLSSFNSSNRSKKSKCEIQISDLGGLGPDIHKCKEKLDNLKKRYEYGQNVSNKNRFRILERKLINNLESLKDGVMND